MADTAAPEGTQVTFLDQTGAKSVEAVVADTVTVRQILPNIITKMNLPMVGPDGQPMSYSLDHKDVYSNILYVKEDRVALSHLAHEAVVIDKYRPETCCIIGIYGNGRYGYIRATVFVLL